MIRKWTVVAVTILTAESIACSAEPATLFGDADTAHSLASLTGFATGRTDSADGAAASPVLVARPRRIRAQNSNARDWYVAFSAGLADVNGAASGTNTFTGVPAYGHSDDDPYLLGGAIGVRTPAELFGRAAAVRIEVQAFGREDMEFVTNSFPAFPAPPSFFHSVQVSDVWNVSCNLWVDIPVTCRCGIYGGFGLGSAGHRTSVSDSITVGSGRSVDFSYTIGAGVNYRLSRDVTLDLGWRFVDLGRARASLLAAGFIPAGNYELDLQSHEFVATIRVDLY